MANGLTFEILNFILLNFYPCSDFIRKWPLQNFREIGSKLTEKSPKIMRSWLIIFNLTASMESILTSHEVAFDADCKVIWVKLHFHQPAVE